MVIYTQLFVETSGFPKKACLEAWKTFPCGSHSFTYLFIQSIFLGQKGAQILEGININLYLYDDLIPLLSPWS